MCECVTRPQTLSVLSDRRCVPANRRSGIDKRERERGGGGEGGREESRER